MKELTPLTEERADGVVVWTGTRRRYTVLIRAFVDDSGGVSAQSAIRRPGGSEEAAFGLFHATDFDDAKERGLVRALIYMRDIDPTTGVVIDRDPSHSS